MELYLANRATIFMTFNFTVSNYAKLTFPGSQSVLVDTHFISFCNALICTEVRN